MVAGCCLFSLTLPVICYSKLNVIFQKDEVLGRKRGDSGEEKVGKILFQLSFDDPWSL